MTWREVPFTPHRQVVHDMLYRARKYHAPVTGCLEIDLTDTRARIRAERRAGRRIGLISFLARATALVVADHPSLQRHLFTTWYGRKREVVFEQIDCTLIVARKAEGEDILIPVNIRAIDKMSVQDIQDLLTRYRTRPLEELEEMQGLEKIKKAPRIALSWFSYKARSDPEFYRQYFGTYGLSSLLAPGGPGNGMATVANTAVAFLPSTIKDRPWVVNGEVVPRSILNLSAVFDHYLVDGGEILKITRALTSYLENPDKVLGPPRSAAEDD